MVAIQQSYGLENNVIMDGRDIGSVVFPNADLKLWLTASVEKSLSKVVGISRKGRYTIRRCY